MLQGRLIDVSEQMSFDDAIKLQAQMYQEQIEDNKILNELHIEKLMQSLSDEDTNDTLPNITPYKYHYKFLIV